MAIRLKPNGKFQVDVTVKGQPRFVQTVHSEEEAKLLEKEKFEELRYGASSRPAVKSTWTLEDAFRRTSESVWDGSKAEVSSIRNAKEAIKFFGEKRPLDTIDTDAIDDYIDFLKDAKKSDATINRKLASLSKMLTVAVQRGHLKAKPFMPRKKEGKGRIRWVTYEEEARMLQIISQMGQDDFYDAVVCLIDTGFRVGELRSLSFRDIDFETNMVTVWDTKNDDSRSVPMTKRVASILSRRMHGELKPFMFSKDWMRTPWDRLKTIMGLAEDSQFVPHCLRHTCASRLVQRGVGLKVVQQWMGHKSIQITLRYAHLAPSNLMDAVKVLESKPELTILRKAN